MYLALKAGKSKKELSLFLITRGVWLIFVDFFILHVAWTFTFDFSLIEFDVLTVTGVGMILLSILLYLPRYLIIGLGIGVIALHNLIDGHDIQYLGTLSWFHLADPFSVKLFNMHIKVYPWYVVIPWAVIPGLGFAFGAIYDLSFKKRSCLLITLGSTCLISFFILRYINIYGDPYHWVSYSAPAKTIYSFMNVSKYPPSLFYVLSTLGFTFFILLIFEKFHTRFSTFLAVFGKVPFAFYILHIVLVHALALIIAYINYGSIAANKLMDNGFLIFDPSTLAPYGYSLIIVYSIWLFVLIIMYPFCKWYGAFKQRHKAITLLSYL